MKHIKKFNESIVDVREFCEPYLANLLDTNGASGAFYEMTFRNVAISGNIRIYIKSNGKQALKWDEFKMDILPFIEVLSNEFKIIGNININGSEFTKEKIFSDEFSLVRLGDWGNYVEEVAIVVREPSFFERKKKK